MQSFKDKLKKVPYIQKLGVYIRRHFLYPKILYFLSTSPKPISNIYGFDRGKPLDRFFIEQFLHKNSTFIKGSCLEVLNDDYLKKYGGENISKYDVLDIEENENATIIDDLRHLTKISDNTYDCLVMTQVFQFIDDLDSAVKECHRILKPNGVMLVTVPAISRCDCASGSEGDYWRFTEAGAKYLFGKIFGANNITCKSYGNARTGIYFYAGLSVEDTPDKLLKTHDKNFPTVVTIKAVKK